MTWSMASKATKAKGNSYQSHCETLMASQENNPSAVTIATRRANDPTVEARMKAAIIAQSKVERNSITNWPVIIIGSRPLGWTSSSPDGPTLYFAAQASCCSLVERLVISMPGKKYSPGCGTLSLSAVITASSFS